MILLRKAVYGVIGSPIEHSKSPDIYNYLFEKYSIDAVYIAIELGGHNIQQFLSEYIVPLNIAGLNVTMPLKEIVAKNAKKLDDLSAKLMSVNTLDCTSGTGYTTDGKGLLLSLDYQGINVTGKKVVVMGAGGAARSICYELWQKGAVQVILNRTKEKAVAVGKDLKAVGDSLDNIKLYMGNCDILINCTSMGMEGKDFEDFSFLNILPANAFVYDIVYEPRETRLLEKAKERGLAACNGLDMLICQALYAFKIYTGIMPSKEDRDAISRIL